MADEISTTDVLTLTTEIVASYVGNNAHIQPAEIAGLIRSVRTALMESDAPPPSANEATFPKADKRAIKKSITPDALISFVDDKPYKTLKRHLSRHGLDMAAYRDRYGLPGDYPSVAPNYSATRSEMAKNFGLGAQRRKASPASAPNARARKKNAVSG